MIAQRVGIALGILVSTVACTQSATVITPIMPVLGDASFVTAVGNSSAVFFGTVLARPGRTTDAVDLSRLTAVVRVDSVMVWGSAVTLKSGEPVTIVVRDTTLLTLNGRYGFLGNGVAIDTGVVVEETWREDASNSARASAFLNAYASALPAAQDRETAAHLAEVDVVFWGPVVAVQTPSLADSVKRKNHYETAPEWREATVAQRRVLCGNPALFSHATRVLFPSSGHIIYANVPRPAVADARVFLLHKANRFPGLPFAGIDTSKAFVLFDGLDVRPAADTTRIAQMLAARPANSRPCTAQ